MKVALFLVAVISLAGCRSSSPRTSNDQVYLRSLSEVEQTRIANGDPVAGDSVRGLMIAFGKPAFSTKTSDGTELVYLRVTSKRYPKEIVFFEEVTWDKTRDFHILVRDEKIVRIKAGDHYEDHNRGVPARPLPTPNPPHNSFHPL